MKKHIAWILAAVLMLGILAGCGGSGGTKDTPAPEAPAAEAGGEVSWADYQAWLTSILPALTPAEEIANAISAEIAALGSWDDVNMDEDPWAKFFGDDTYNASTWDEFVAAGGVGTYDETYVDEGSGEPSGDPSGESAS